jgi:hypothetical protein
MDRNIHARVTHSKPNAQKYISCMCHALGYDAGMQTEKTQAMSVRLPVSVWVKLRQLMQLKGRAWLEKAVQREHRKEFGK